MVRARWILLFALAGYALVQGIVALATGTLDSLVGEVAVPLNALLFALAYNFLSDRLRPLIATVRQASTIQFAVDIIIVALVLVFTGGPESWLWVIYILIIFEAATIARERSDVWLVAGLTVLAMTVVDWSGLPSALAPFGAHPVGPEWLEWPALTTRYALHVAVLLATAGMSSVVIVSIHEALDRARDLTIADEQTGCPSRAAFHRGLETEYERAIRSGRPIYVVLVDIDNLSGINARFGIDVGDAVIVRVAATITDSLRGICSGGWSPNAVYRVSGEEFALVVVDSAAGGGYPSDEEVAQLAELIRTRVSHLDWGGVSVTVSAGAARATADTSDAEELLLLADDALARAVAAGGNRISTSWDGPEGPAVTALGRLELEYADDLDDKRDAGGANPFVAQYVD